MIRPIIAVASGTRLLEPDGTVRSFALRGAFPNPFNPQTTIRFDLPQSERVRLTLFDVLGRERDVLASGLFGSGSHAISLNGAKWSSGVYFVRLQTERNAQTAKIVLEK